MKKNIHPSVYPTQIQRKDGSSYTKYWLYRRSTLILEEDYKVWEPSKNAFNNWQDIREWTADIEPDTKVFAVSEINKKVISYWK